LAIASNAAFRIEDAASIWRRSRRAPKARYEHKDFPYKESSGLRHSEYYRDPEVLKFISEWLRRQYEIGSIRGSALSETTHSRGDC
jgi:hypothetical protein